MGSARKGAAAIAAPDPSAPDSTWYVYALLGRDDIGALTSYEFLPVTIAPNGRQTVSTTWTAGGTDVTTQGRWQIGAWLVDDDVSDAISNADTWIYVGTGYNTVASPYVVGTMDAALVSAGGQLINITPNVAAPSPARAGYGVLAASNKLFAFGGNGATGDSTVGADLGSPAPALNNWNNGDLALTTSRYLMGSTIQSAFVFLIGGTSGSTVLNSTETVVW
jgi:hypothetical protein